MARIPREVVEAVRERTDLVEVIGRHVALQKRGGSHIGLCPFHQEKTPSFHVVPHKNFYHCFGCGSSGDVFRFLQEIEGLGFAEAVRELAGPAGIEIKTEDLTEAERDRLRRRATLYDVLSEAAGLYASTLLTRAEGESARAYLADRDLSPETLETWQLGWAPEGWQHLLDHLRQRGIGQELAIEAGLARSRERGDGAYDAFRGRVMVPIRDERGRVIAMGGRILDGDGPKYINSPETSLYRKSSVLFGMDRARRAIERTGRAILVEGYFDVISLHQAGFEEAVATCGTALTGEHAEKLRRMCRKVYVVTDADEAGMRAAERSLPLLEAAHIASFRLQIPDAKDPDELIRERGAEAFERLLGEARPLLAWVAQRQLDAHGYSAAGKEAARDAMVDLLGGISAVQATELAPVLRIPEGELLAWTRAHSGPAKRRPATPDAPAPVTGWKPTREAVHLLWMALHHPDQAGPRMREVPADLLDAVVRPVLARLIDGDAATSILDDVTDPGVRRTLSAVIARASLYTAPDVPPAVAEIAGRLALQRSEGVLAHAQDAAVAALRRGEKEIWDAQKEMMRDLDEARRALDGSLRDLAAARRLAASGRIEAIDAVDPATRTVLDHVRTVVASCPAPAEEVPDAPQADPDKPPSASPQPASTAPSPPPAQAEDAPRPDDDGGPPPPPPWEDDAIPAVEEEDDADGPPPGW